MYLSKKIFLKLLDMKSKKVYVYVIIVIWNFNRGSESGQKCPRGAFREQKHGTGRILCSGISGQPEAPIRAKDQQKSNKPRSDEKDF
jgi:hypothetical protein